MAPECQRRPLAVLKVQVVISADNSVSYVTLCGVTQVTAVYLPRSGAPVYVRKGAEKTVPLAMIRARHCRRAERVQWG